MPSATGTSSARPYRVLIADDDPQGVELLEAYLSGTDYETQTAADGEETLAKVTTWQPDLILLDVMMPKLSGFEVCKRLKADPKTRAIAVLMVTALDQQADVERAGKFELGRPVEVAQREDEPRFIEQDRDDGPFRDASESEIGLEELPGLRDVGDGEVEMIQLHGRYSIRNRVEG